MGIKEELSLIKNKREQEVRQEQTENKTRSAKQQELKMGLSEEQKNKMTDLGLEKDIAEQQYRDEMLTLMKRQTAAILNMATEQRMQTGIMERQSEALWRIERRLAEGVAVVNAYDKEGNKILLWIADEYAP